MKTLWIAVRMVAAILTLMLGWAVLCPIMVSAGSDLIVVLGIAMIFLVPVITYIIVRPIIKQAVKQAKKERKYWNDAHRW